MRLAGLESGETTFGHRYEGGHARIGSAATYLEDLRAVRAMADAGERRAAIVAGLDAAGPWADPGGKLEEVVHLVEWPVVLEGRFDRRYLDLPDRVVITAMQSHQRYFPLRAGGGELEPRFLFVANGGDPDVVRAGNEEVLVGRLDDAAFAHRRDLDRGLEAMAARARARELPGGLGVDRRQGGAPGPAGRAPVRRKRPRGGGAGRRRPGGGAVQGRPGVGPRERVCRPRGLCGLSVRAGRRRGRGGLRRHRGAPPARARRAASCRRARPARCLRSPTRPTRSPWPSSAASSRPAAATRSACAGLRPAWSRSRLHRGYALDPRALVGERAAAFVLDRLEPLLLDEGVTVEEVRAARGSGALEPVAVAALARALHAFAGPRRDLVRDAYGRCVRIAGSTPPGAIDPALVAEPAERDLAAALDRSAGDARAGRRAGAGRDPLLRRRPGHGPRRGGAPEPAHAGRQRRRRAARSRGLRTASGIGSRTCPNGSRSTSCPTRRVIPPRASAGRRRASSTTPRSR